MRRIRFKASLLALLAATGTISAADQDLSSRIASDAARLRDATKNERTAAPSWKDQKADFEKVLSRIQDDLASGRAFRALELLGQARELAAGFETLDPASANLPAFESAWTRADARLSAEDAKARRRPPTDAPAALRALSEASQGKTLVLLEASRAFARATNAESGFYYIRRATLASEFASFCDSLKAPRRGSPFPLRSVAPELERLQARTNAAFQPPRSIDLHSNFIRLNATLKAAGELDSAGLFAGALYQYLDAVAQFGALETSPPEAAGEAGLKGSLERMKSELASSGRDDSIGELFAERAEELATLPASAPSEAEARRRVRIIVEQVLPAYLATAEPAPSPPPPAAGAVTVTLVRWPYT